MATKSAQQAGGRATAKKLRQAALDRYYLDPSKCLLCGKIIEVSEGRKVCETIHRKFCNKSCAAKYNNSISPKRIAKKRPCEVCGKQMPITRSRFCCCKCRKDSSKIRLGKVSKGYIFEKYPAWQTARTMIREHAAWVFNNKVQHIACAVCGYQLHVEKCHIKPVSAYPPEALISDINSHRNLIGLCPNCHWEFDNGLLDLTKHLLPS